MSTPNPYAAPKAPVADQKAILPGNFTPGGQARPAGEGWSWIAEGWRFFMKAPGTWIGISLVGMVIFIVLAIIPFLGGIALSLLAPVFAGFQTQLGNLVAVGAIYLGLSLVIMLIIMVVTGASMFAMFGAGGGQDAAAAAGALTTMVLAMLLGLALFVPLAMLMWFAPALVALNAVGPVEAMKQSFSGCLRNIVPFLVYGIVLFVLAIVASLPILLGWLVLGPVTAASVYTSYRDIYLS